MSFFGYPRAYGNDAVRAVCAALELLNAINIRKAAANSYWKDISIRVGIASGVTLVGDAGGSGKMYDQVVIGEAPNLAARLQSEAQPDTVMVCGNTHYLIHNSFELKYLGNSSLRGYKMPQKLWQVAGPSNIQTHAYPSKPAKLMELAGRVKKYGRLVELWDLARTQSGRVALISGETGTGKTKLLETLRINLSRQCSEQFILQCSPENIKDILRPHISQLQVISGTATENFCAGKKLSGKGVSDWPCLIILEDAQRCDSAALALIDKLIAQTPDKPILLAISHQPDFQPPKNWLKQGHVETIRLSPLHQAAARAFILRRAGNRQISAHSMSGIIAKGDGIPMFLEELTRKALQTRRKTNGSRQPSREEFQIPDKIWTVLMARLDRHEPVVRKAAKIGAALGRKFNYSLLAEMWPHNRNELDHALNSLLRSGELLKTGNIDGACYKFKWALMWEVARQSTLRRVRQDLHRQSTRVQE